MENTKLILLTPLSFGKHAIVDTEDYFLMNLQKWTYHKNKNVARRKDLKDSSRVSTTVYLHREIMGTKEGIENVSRSDTENKQYRTGLLQR